QSPPRSAFGASFGVAAASVESLVFRVPHAVRLLTKGRSTGAATAPGDVRAGSGCPGRAASTAFACRVSNSDFGLVSAFDYVHRRRIYADGCWWRSLSGGRSPECASSVPAAGG